MQLGSSIGLSSQRDRNQGRFQKLIAIYFDPLRVERFVALDRRHFAAEERGCVIDGFLLRGAASFGTLSVSRRVLPLSPW